MLKECLWVSGVFCDDSEHPDCMTCSVPLKSDHEDFDEEDFV